MDQVQDMKKKEYIMKEEITTEDPVTQEVLVGVIDITHLLTQLEIGMHLKIQGAVHKCLMLDIKEEDMSWTVCKEILEA
jgi:hypothetical protein